MPWTLKGLLGDAAVAAEATGDTAVTDLVYDSRTVTPGALF